MIAKFFIFCISLLPLTAMAQTEVWIKVDSGAVLYLSPYDSEWIPVSEKQKIPSKTYLSTKAATRATLFRETAAYPLPADAYFYVEDAFEKSRVEIVAALTRIEAAQLPVNIQAPDDQRQKTLGLTYGEKKPANESTGEVPHEAARHRAIRWFVEHEQPHAALLSLKRMLTKFPSLYAKQQYVDQLLFFYI